MGTRLTKWIIALWCAAPVWAGARIDLRPTPPVPPEGYEPNTIVSVDVYLVDTGNPQGDIPFRGIAIDFSDSYGSAFPGTPPLGPNQFLWENPFGLGSVFPDLPFTAWIDPFGVDIPLIRIVLPDDSEVRLGGINVQVGTMNGLLDVLNVDEPDMKQGGARAAFGYGGQGDPVTDWRAYTGELTGGRLDLFVVPEPGSLILLLGASATVIRRRRVT